MVSTAARGRGVATKLATPTINLAPYSELLPPHGVYVTRVRLGEGASAPMLDAVTNAGIRPTFEGAGYAVESHLLDGPPPVEVTDATPVEVCFLMRLREERRFPSPEALRAQIGRDVARAREYFRRMRRCRIRAGYGRFHADQSGIGPDRQRLIASLAR